MNCSQVPVVSFGSESWGPRFEQSVRDHRTGTCPCSVLIPVRLVQRSSEVCADHWILIASELRQEALGGADHSVSWPFGSDPLQVAHFCSSGRWGGWVHCPNEQHAFNTETWPLCLQDHIVDSAICCCLWLSSCDPRTQRHSERVERIRFGASSSLSPDTVLISSLILGLSIGLSIERLWTSVIDHTCFSPCASTRLTFLRFSVA